MHSMVRSIALLLLPLASLSSPAVGQGEVSEVGIVVGLNLADFHGSDASGANTRTGFQGGGFISLPFSRSLAVQVGLGYSQQGAKVDVGGGTTGTFQLDYILIPALLKLSAPLANNRSLRPYADLGPVLGVRTKCKVKVAGGGVPTTEVDCKDPILQLDTKSVDFSLAFGAGLDIGAATVGLRYQLGLTSIDNTGSSANIKNRVLSIIGGYRFRLGH